MASPELRNVNPIEGTPIPAWQRVEFDVVDENLAFQVLKLEIVFTSGLTELVYDQSAGGFQTEYALGSAITSGTYPISMVGYHFSIARQNGWISPLLVFRITVLDSEGNEIIVPGGPVIIVGNMIQGTGNDMIQGAGNSMKQGA